MKTNNWRRPVVLVLLGAMTGCAQLRPDFNNWAEGSEQISGVDKHSSFPAVRRPAFEQVNLIELVDPGREAERKYALAWNAASKRPDAEKESTVGVQYDLALAAFRERPDSATNAKRTHRDAVQDRILGVSTSRCNVFKTYLRRQQVDAKFLLGSLTTVSGVLGAVLPGVKASRNLAGAAGLFSGVQAEHDSSYYSNLTAQVIVHGIEAYQARLLSQIVEGRRNRNVDEYGMEAAIKDAVYFDGTCSTVVGLLEAAEAIKEVNNPGLLRAAEMIAAVKAMNTISQAPDMQSLMQSGDLQQLLKQTVPKASPLVVATATLPGAPSTIAWKVATAVAAPTHLQLYVEDQALELARSYLWAQAHLPTGTSKSGADVGAKAQGKFHSEMTKQLEADPFGLRKCVKATESSLIHLRERLAEQGLSDNDSAQRLATDLSVTSALAEANAATAKVEWLLERAKAYVRQVARQWQNELTKPEANRSHESLQMVVPDVSAIADAACK